MREVEYGEAAVEVLDILNYTSQEDVRKIPQSFIKFLTEIANKNYKVNFNHNDPISGLNLRKQTRELLGFIYITWWCNEKDKSKLKNIRHTYNLNVEETKEIENYNINDMFKDKKEEKANKIVQNESTIAMETSMVEYKEKSILKKFIGKILSFFGIKKERS